MRVHKVGGLLTHNPEDFARFSELIVIVPLVGPSQELPKPVFRPVSDFAIATVNRLDESGVVLLR